MCVLHLSGTHFLITVGLLTLTVASGVLLRLNYLTLRTANVNTLPSLVQYAPLIRLRRMALYKSCVDWLIDLKSCNGLPVSGNCTFFRYAANVQGQRSISQRNVIYQQQKRYNTATDRSVDRLSTFRCFDMKLPINSLFFWGGAYFFQMTLPVVLITHKVPFLHLNTSFGHKAW